MGCQSIAILPEGMSKERFEWLSKVAGEVIKTPGSEANVKEIFDKCWELRRSGQDLMIFNQFEEFGNYLWHYEVTGHAMQEVIEHELRAGGDYRGIIVTTGSAGPIACGDYLKQAFPGSKIGAAEALQCPTLLENGFGAHRIEGIGDKHVPWIHNGKNTDLVIALDDNVIVRRGRLQEMQAEYGDYTEVHAAADFARYLQGLATDGMLELRYPDRRRIHNLKYFTWVEQQGRTHAALGAQWHDPEYWA